MTEKELQKFLKEHALGKEGFKETLFFKYLSEKRKMILEENLFYANITSFANKSTPDRLRIRSDIFLKASSEGECFLVSGFLYENKVNFLFFYSAPFSEYEKSTSSSNSFINFSLEQLFNFFNYSGLQYTPAEKHRQYFFYSFSDEIFDEDFFESFLFDFQKGFLRFSRNENNYEKLISKYDPPILIDLKNDVKEKYNFSCAVNFLNKNLCRTKIDWVKTNEAIKNTSLNLPINFHHFIPRKYFKDNCSEILNWKNIHSEINIVPLCEICHNSIHSKDNVLVSETFNNLINVYLKNNRKEEFEFFLKTNTEFKEVSELLEYYKKN